MRNQESFVDSARWQKSGVKSVVFIMCPFLSFNKFFSVIVLSSKLALLLWKYCLIEMEFCCIGMEFNGN